MSLSSLLQMDQMKCRFLACSFQTRSAAAYASHLTSHRLDRRFVLVCPFCYFKSETPRGLQTHISRNHGHKQRTADGESHSNAVPVQLTTVKCGIAGCSARPSTVIELKNHLKHDHISRGETIMCPFGLCAIKDKKPNWITSFSSVKNFNVHMARYHCNATLPQPEDLQLHTSTRGSSTSFDQSCASTSFDSPMDFEEQLSESEDNPCQDGDLIDLVAKFYLKLEGFHLLPASVVQKICEDLTVLLEVSRQCVEQKLSTAMINEGLKEDIAKKIAHLALISDPLYKVHHKQMGQIALASEFLRSKYYKENFQLREPETLVLKHEDGTTALDTFRKPQTIQYLDMRQTLEDMLNDPSVQTCVEKSFEIISQPSEITHEAHKPKIFHDFTDGQIFQNHPASKEKCIQLLLFQDGFGVTNPLGSAKNKHKTVGVYFTLGNLPPEKRSKVDVLKLVALIPEKYLKSEKARDKKKKHDMCWKPIFEALEDLKKNGIMFKGQCLPVYLMFVLGDNLGSHQLGGFTEYFGGDYWCRYCDMSSKDFHETPHLVNNLRTPEQYDKDAEEALNSNETQFKGVKFNSIFNRCSEFHVCRPGLPPCIAHDCYEGSISHDMPLMIQYFIEKKWFTRAKLNSQITNFKGLGMDARDKPAFIELNKKKKIKEKLSGHAVQNWNFLRFFPLILGPENIKDVQDPVWQLNLKLKQICEIISAPSISQTDTLRLKCLTEEYLYERQRLFPGKPLRPKHHFIMHYAYLIILCGPLIRLFTLRMESKHPIFKKAARNCQNFIEIYKTMARKHQLREAYEKTGPLIPDDMSYTLAAASAHSIYEEDVVHYINSNLKLPATAFSLQSVILNGTRYERLKSWVVVSREEGCLVVGQVTAIFCIEENVPVILLRLYTSSIVPNSYGLHELSLHDCRGISHISRVNDLDSYYPLSSYEFDGKLCLSLKYWPPAM